MYCTNNNDTISWISRRNGITISLFNEEKISNALFRALKCSDRDKTLSTGLTHKVIKKLVELGFNSRTPTVEDIQDVVQLVLIENNCQDVAKNYILYRFERRIFRESMILSSPILTSAHKLILNTCNSLSTIPSSFNPSLPLRKEYYELEKLEYLIIEPNQFGGIKISLNPKKLEQIKFLVINSNALAS